MEHEAKPEPMPEKVFSASSANEMLKKIEDTTRAHLKSEASKLLDAWWKGIKAELLANLNESISVQLNSHPNMHSVEVHVVFKGWK